MTGTALGPSIWTVSDGSAGNASQTQAIAHALGETRRWMQIAHIKGEGYRDTPLTLSPRAPWTWLPAKYWAFAKRALPGEQAELFRPPWPNVWIGAGRRTAPYSAAVRQWSGGQTLCIHILDSGLPPEAFDILSTPAHDGLNGANVIQTVGSPAYFSPEAIEEAGLSFADLADERGKSVLVLLGGDSNAHRFDPQASERLCQQLTQIAGRGWRLRISASRRTPIPVRAKFRSLAAEIGARFWEGPSDGPNPYLGWLAFSDAAIVTEDSANMLSDVAYFGLPIHIARLSGGSEKFDRLHRSFVKRDCARWLEDDLQLWTYTPLREAERVADAIVAALLERYPQPDIPPSPPSSSGDGKVAPPDWL